MGEARLTRHFEYVLSNENVSIGARLCAVIYVTVQMLVIVLDVGDIDDGDANGAVVHHSEDITTVYSCGVDDVYLDVTERKQGVR